jgi:hypothetical protein
MTDANHPVKYFFVREDSQYDRFVVEHQAATAWSRLTYLGLHLLPGILAFLLINVPAIYHAAVNLTGLSGTLLQALYLAVFSCLWHLLWPLFALHWQDKLSFRESLAFLGLARFDAKGLFLVMPVLLVVFIAVTLPYVNYLYLPFQAWLNSIPILRMPSYSMFQEGRIYSLPPALLVTLGIGNYLGEEVYYRGYLLKKIGFLGPWAWVINSVLFGLYHVWQAPETWPLVPSALFFGLLMQWRKNLYPLIFFHLLVNLVLGAMIGFAHAHVR